MLRLYRPALQAGDPSQPLDGPGETYHADARKDMVIYKIITGTGKSTTATATREEFARWAKHEVVFKDNQWKLLEIKDKH